MPCAVPTRFRDPLHDPDPVRVRQFQSLIGAPPELLEGQAATLARALTQGDALADAWLAWGGSASERRAWVERALTHGIDALPDAPAPLVALFRKLEGVPIWVEPKRLLLGARTFRRTGMLGQLVLADFGLMAGYGSSAVVKPLVMTGQLTDHTAERLIHTGRFVTQVTEPGALVVGGEGYRGAVRVRLVHAAIRKALRSSPEWRAEEWGLPINQADMLATNLLFSIGVIEGCRKLGLRFRVEEVDALVHLWRYVGYLVGVDESLLPTDWESARRAFYLVGVSQPPPDEDSRVLASALHRVPLTFARSKLAERLIRIEMGVRLGFTRRMLGDETADALGLPRSELARVVPLVVGSVRLLELARRALPRGDRIAFELGDRLVKGLQKRIDGEFTRARAGLTSR